MSQMLTFQNFYMFNELPESPKIVENHLIGNSVTRTIKLKENLQFSYSCVPQIIHTRKDKCSKAY